MLPRVTQKGQSQNFIKPEPHTPTSCYPREDNMEESSPQYQQPVFMVQSFSYRVWTWAFIHPHQMMAPNMELRKKWPLPIGSVDTVWKHCLVLAEYSSCAQSPPHDAVRTTGCLAEDSALCSSSTRCFRSSTPQSHGKPLFGFHKCSGISLKPMLLQRNTQTGQFIKNNNIAHNLRD